MLDHNPHACASFADNLPVSQREHFAQGLLETCLSLARFRAGNSHQVDDLAQDAAIKAIEALPQYQNRNGAAISTFLGTVARNAITDLSRHESRLESKHQPTARDGANIDHPIPDSDVQPDLAADRFYAPDQYAEYADTLNVLFEVAADLPPRQQMLLERHCLGAGDSIKALAEEFQCSVQSLYQARDALFQKLDCAGVSPPQ